MVSRKYETWEEFFVDVDLMCSNAFTYNEDDSEVYKDAQQIKVSHSILQKLMIGHTRLSSQGDQ